MVDVGGSRDPFLLAFLLPQFHPVPENDEWWGRGFTEWRNVAQGRPRFRGHYQPHLPADLGFYDLRLAETRAAQAELAGAHGLSAFCWYHYWFNGRRVLERPFQEVLAAGKPDFPFVLCWANENWTRVWDGGDDEILLQQRYSAQDDAAHIADLLPIFADDRYVTLDGKPIFLVYGSRALPEPRRTTDAWRAAARRHGFPDLHLCRVDRVRADLRNPPSQLGFDAAVGFQPGAGLPWPPVRSLVGQAASRVTRGRVQPRQSVYSYANVSQRLGHGAASWPRYETVFPSWDNSVRRRRGATVMAGSTPDLYRAWLDRVVGETVRDGSRAPLVFLNAWNEWAEGAHLEPDLRWGRGYLEATRDVVARYRT